MCGIAGFFSPLKHPPGSIQAMISSLKTRGPDASGIWVSNSRQAYIAHTRLAIIDLSSCGNQPMEGERYVLSFNGEIYNYQSVRNKLAKQGLKFLGHSDTEVLLKSIETQGLSHTLEEIEGMFAFCLYDKLKHEALLVRDRMGEKPLYYAKENNTFFFGSELKAIKAHSAFSARINTRALGLYFNHNTIPAPHSVYQNCYKLEPGSVLKLNCSTLEFSLTHYWSSKEVMLNGAQKPYSGSPEASVEHLDELLKKAISEQMISDVPLGAFLSGGIDSSTVVSLMQSLSPTPVNTFSIGFQEKGYNEAEFAKEIAQHLGTNHTELYISDNDAKNVIPELPKIYCEPFADSSQIPTYLVSKLAKDKVTVALSGDGGDELFGGYSRYRSIKKAFVKRKPKLSEALAYHIDPAIFNRIWGLTLALKGKYSSFPSHLMRAKYYKYSEKNRVEFYRRSICFWSDIHIPTLEETATLDYALRGLDTQSLETLDQLTLFQTLDMNMYLPDVILNKVDRAAMSVSLETRVPLLNHKVVEFAASLPASYRNKDGKVKWPLQAVLSKYVPNHLFERPKKGFSVPVGPWLKGPLKSWMLDLLSPERLQQQGLFDYKKVEPVLKAHLEGGDSDGNLLWSMLMFQSWYDEYH